MYRLPAADASNAFGLSLTQTLAQKSPGENLFLSPVSVFLALAMTANGGVPETRRAILTGLRLPDRLSESNQQCRNLLEALQAPDPGVNLVLANALWAFLPHRFDPDVVQRCQTGFQAELRSVNLTGAAATINAWAAAKTKNLVRQVVFDRDFTGRLPTYFVLSNATYFKGRWTSSFDSAQTRPGPFLRQDGTLRTVPLMHLQGSVELERTPVWTAVRLPYGTGRYALYGYLPTPGTTPESLLPQLAALWGRGRPALRPVATEVVFPKMVLDLPRQDLVPSLSARKLLGNNDVTPLEGPGIGKLLIRHVFHKTRLEIDEEGTRAAAVTVVVVKGRGGASGIAFNRPFVLCLADDQTGAILFSGIVHDPQV